MFLLGVLFASAAAVAYGVSTVLRAMGARDSAIREAGVAGAVTKSDGPSLSSTVDTFRTPQFVWGTVFLVVGFAGGAVAARFLPLFLSQTIVSGNLIVTALIGSVVLKNRLHTRDWVAMTAVIASLCALGLSSSHHTGGGEERSFHWVLFGGTMLLCAITLLCVWQLGKRAPLVYGALAGCMFGIIAVGVRVLDGVDPFDPVTLLLDPAAWTIAVAGSVGFYVQTVALQVGQVNGVTAVLVVGETALPGFIGVLFLDDTAKPGLQWLAAVGFVGAVVGAVLVALYNADESDHLDERDPPAGGWSLKGRFGSASAAVGASAVGDSAVGDSAVGAAAAGDGPGVEVSGLGPAQGLAQDPAPDRI